MTPAQEKLVEFKAAFEHASKLWEEFIALAEAEQKASQAAG